MRAASFPKVAPKVNGVPSNVAVVLTRREQPPLFKRCAAARGTPLR